MSTPFLYPVRPTIGFPVPIAFPLRFNDFTRCGNNYGWVRFEGSRCTEYSEDEYGPCADADRSDLTLPFFEYCHDSYDSSGSSEDAYTNGIDICGDRSIIGSAVMGESAVSR